MREREKQERRGAPEEGQEGSLEVQRTKEGPLGDHAPKAGTDPVEDAGAAFLGGRAVKYAGSCQKHGEYGPFSPARKIRYKYGPKIRKKHMYIKMHSAGLEPTTIR